jgi:hypothetical protein
MGRTIIVSGLEVTGTGTNLVEVALHFDEAIGVVNATVVSALPVAPPEPVRLEATSAEAASSPAASPSEASTDPDPGEPSN